MMKLWEKAKCLFFAAGGASASEEMRKLQQQRFFDLLVLLSVVWYLAKKEYTFILDYGEIAGSPMPMSYYSAFAFFSLLCIPLLFLKKKNYLFYYFVLVPLTVIPILIQILLTRYYSLRFDATSYHLCFCSSWFETKNYLVSLGWTAPALLLAMIAILTVSGLFCVGCSRSRSARDPLVWVAAVCLCLPSVFMCVKAHRGQSAEYGLISNSSGLPGLFYGMYCGMQETRGFKALSDHPVLPEGVRLDEGTGDCLGVIVIGESAIRSRFSVFGFKRETTPNLAKIRSELFLFNHAISLHKTTSKNLEAIFTVCDLESGKPMAFQPELPAKLGVREAFYSTQQGWSTGVIAQFIFAHCEPKKFLSTDLYIDTPDMAQAEALCSHLDASGSEGGPQIIYLHMNGSHVPFDIRCPPEYRKFTQTAEGPVAKYLASYDDSICYTDLVLGRIISLLKKQKRPAFLLFLSDHGEALWEGMSEQDMKLIRNPDSPECFEIAMFLWLSPEFRVLHPEQVKNLERNASKPFCSDTVVYSVLSLLGISFDHFPWELDLCSGQYRSQENRAPYLHVQRLKNKVGR